MIGRTLSHYKVLEKIGEGGMGEVYVAEDTKLSRKVALKVLLSEMAENAERRARFEREAKAVAALDHPNIVTIHSVEEAEGVHFYTMQLVKGKTLTELIPKKGMALNKFFEIAIPLADAVSAAHEQGIIHRDLKPDNLMVSDDGRLKILDFGLAKLKPGFTGEGASELPTQSATAEGRILGTVAYMSPEQAEGKTVDHRSDVFSIGVILYEMATGERPFKGDTAASLLSSILKDKPQSATEMNPALPRDLGKVIRRCLAKDSTRRYQSALDIRNELEELKQDVDSGEVVEGTIAVTPSHKRRWPLAALAAVAIVATIGTYMLMQLEKEGGEGPPTPLVGTFTQLTSGAGEELLPSLSPDGKYVSYTGSASGNWDIYLLRIGGERPINLTEDCLDDDTHPVFSPDGEQIAFRSEREGGGIFLMGATGESVRRLTDFGYNPAWSPDGKEILCATYNVTSSFGRSSSSAIWAVRVPSGETRVVTEGDFGKGDGVQPSWSPNGHRIAFWTLVEGYQRDIFTIPAEGGDARPVTQDKAVDWAPFWSPDGRYLYFVSDRSGSMNLWRVPVDELSGELLGEAEPVTAPSSLIESMSISRDGGLIAYSSVVRERNLWKIGFDPSLESVKGDPIPVTRGSRIAHSLDLSPDNRQIAFVLEDKWRDIAVVGADGGAPVNLTNDSWADFFPRFAPDGETIAFYSNRSGEWQVFSINRDGSRLQQLTYGPAHQHSIWSPTGARMITLDRDPRHLITFDPRIPWGEQTPDEFPPFGEKDRFFTLNMADWSRDGRLLAGAIFLPDISQRVNIAVLDLVTQEYRVLTDFDASGRNFVFCPRWLSDSRRLLFNYSGKIMLLDTDTKQLREVLSLDPDFLLSLGISSDDDWLYFDRAHREADIWMLTLN